MQKLKEAINMYYWIVLSLLLGLFPALEGCSKSPAGGGLRDEKLNHSGATVTVAGRTVTINKVDLLQLVDKDDRSLWEACFAGDLKGVTAFERDPGEISNNTTVGSLSLLHIAVVTGDTSFLSYLVSRGCDIQAKTDAGISVLHAAVDGGNLANVEFLLAKGVDVNVITHEGISPLCQACKNNQFDIIKVLVEKGADVNLASEGMDVPILQACLNGNLDALKLLVKHGADINARNLTLQIGVMVDKMDVVDFLIQNGCNVNQIDEFGVMPLGTAAALGNTKMVKRLLDAGADVNRKEKEGALYAAVLEIGKLVLPVVVVGEKLETIQCLLDAGATITPEIIQAASNDDIRNMLKNSIEGNPDDEK